MLLRSSQFVFLLLLACAVQQPEAYALHLVSAAVTGRSIHDRQTSGHQRNFAQHQAGCSSHAPDPCAPTSPRADARLDAASLAVRRTPWPMRPPALSSAFVSSFTSLLRA